MFRDGSSFVELLHIKLSTKNELDETFPTYYFVPRNLTNRSSHKLPALVYHAKRYTLPVSSALLYKSKTYRSELGNRFAIETKLSNFQRASVTDSEESFQDKEWIVQCNEIQRS